MRKQFNLQDWLKDKSQKVETRDGRPARIICTDAKADDGACIVALIPGYGGEEAYQFFPDGRAFSSKSSDEDCADLFIITPEPEMSELELAIAKYRPPTDSKETIQRIAAELLSLARKQLQPEIDAEIEKAYKTADEVMYRKGKEDGIAEARNDITARIVALKQAKDRAEEALKDLPRWKPSNCPRSNLPSLYLTGDDTALYKDGYEISISGLEKLPKEETNL